MNELETWRTSVHASLAATRQATAPARRLRRQPFFGLLPALRANRAAPQCRSRAAWCRDPARRRECRAGESPSLPRPVVHQPEFVERAADRVGVFVDRNRL